MTTKCRETTLYVVTVHVAVVVTRRVALHGAAGAGAGWDALAGRVMLQTMLPAAVRLASAITSRPDVLGDQDEAFALVLAAVRCRPTCDGPS